jgi:hypothetical protein
MPRSKQAVYSRISAIFMDRRGRYGTDENLHLRSRSRQCEDAILSGNEKRLLPWLSDLFRISVCTQMHISLNIQIFPKHTKRTEVLSVEVVMVGCGLKAQLELGCVLDPAMHDQATRR